MRSAPDLPLLFRTQPLDHCSFLDEIEHPARLTERLRGSLECARYLRQEAGSPSALYASVWPLLPTSGGEARRLMHAHPELVRELEYEGTPRDITPSTS